jgi:hypothetical protein
MPNIFFSRKLFIQNVWNSIHTQYNRMFPLNKGMNALFSAGVKATDVDGDYVEK